MDRFINHKVVTYGTENRTLTPPDRNIDPNITGVSAALYFKLLIFYNMNLRLGSFTLYFVSKLNGKINLKKGLKS